MIPDRFNQIPRVEGLSREEFEQEWLLQQRPVILTDLYKDQPIRKLTSLEMAGREHGDAPILVGEGFRPYLFTDPANFREKPYRDCSIRDYLKFVAENPDSLEHCSENEIPNSVKALFEIPEYCNYGLQEDQTGRFFIGGEGNYAHLHCDGDLRHVLFYQAVGSKRIITFPPDSAPKLAPNRHHGLVCLEHFTEEEKDDFVQFAGGAQCILNAGEALLFPAAVWHYLEYTEPGISVAIRFGRNHFTQFLGDNCHMDKNLQRVGARLTDESQVHGKRLEAYRLIEATYHQPCAKAEEKARQMTSVYERAWKLLADRPDPIYQIPKTSILDNSLRMSDTSRYRDLVDNKLCFATGWDALQDFGAPQQGSNHRTDRFEYMRKVMLKESPPERSKNPQQRPAIYCPGLTDRPWHETSEYPWIEQIEQKFPVIQREFLHLREQATGFQPYSEPREFSSSDEPLHESGDWNVFYFYFEGKKYQVNCDSCPETIKILDSIPRAGGMACISGLAPGTHIKPHCGPFNTTLRCHLGLSIPDGCRMRVGDETRTWSEGQCVLFDDTFEHEVWNEGSETRFVLLFDVYHPDLSDEEVTQLRELWGSDQAKTKLQPWWNLIEETGNHKQRTVPLK